MDKAMALYEEMHAAGLAQKPYGTASYLEQFSKKLQRTIVRFPAACRGTASHTADLTASWLWLLLEGPSWDAERYFASYLLVNDCCTCVYNGCLLFESPW